MGIFLKNTPWDFMFYKNISKQTKKNLKSFLQD